MEPRSALRPFGRRALLVSKDGSKQVTADGGREGFGAFLLRLWMWAVPVVMFIAAMFFAVIAALDGRWPLLGMMLFMALIAVGLFALHWWVMRGLGRTDQ